MKILNEIKKIIKKAAKQYKVRPYDVTTSQFRLVAKDSIKEWELRKLGGFNNLRDTIFPSDKASSVLPRKSPKFKLVTKKLENFTVHEANIKDLFKQAKLKDNEVLRIAVMPDSHVPEQDHAAIDCFTSFLEYYKPHGLINLGDFLECEPVSHWNNTNEKPRRLVPQIKEAKALLQRLNDAAGPQCIFKRFLVGNHEDWLNQYLTARIPEVLDGLEELGTSLKIENLLDLKELGYRSIPLNEVLKLGSAHFIHGFYTGNGHAKKHLDVFGVNIYYGHLHDVQSYCGVSVNGIHEAASLGCLRTLNAPFLKGKPNNWSHSISMFEFRKDGTFTRYTPIIINGQMSFNGVVFGK